MKAVMAFSAKTATAAKDAFAGMKSRLSSGSAGAEGGSGSSGGGGGGEGKKLGGMSRGLSAVGSLMEFAAERQRAASLDQGSRDEVMAGRAEYIQAAEKVTAIDAEYNKLVGSQLVAASSMGIDASSGSVIAAREAAQNDADRERRTIRNSAEANAKMRQVRALGLKQAAKNARLGSALKLGLDLGQAAAGGR